MQAPLRGRVKEVGEGEMSVPALVALKVAVAEGGLQPSVLTL